MPEMTFEIQWPNGQRQQCYSPSLVMHDYLVAGSAYTVADFVTRSSTALAEAGDRVRAKFGFACTSAAETNARIVKAAAQFAPTATVHVVSMRPELT